MEKKIFMQPVLKVYNVKSHDVICTSDPIQGYNGPLGAPGRQEDDSWDF